jgi:hypothetical protein
MDRTSNAGRRPIALAQRLEALEQPAVEQDAPPTQRDQVLAAGHRAGSAMKLDFHDCAVSRNPGRVSAFGLSQPWPGLGAIAAAMGLAMGRPCGRVGAGGGAAARPGSSGGHRSADWLRWARPLVRHGTSKPGTASRGMLRLMSFSMSRRKIPRPGRPARWPRPARRRGRCGRCGARSPRARWAARSSRRAAAGRCRCRAPRCRWPPAPRSSPLLNSASALVRALWLLLPWMAMARDALLVQVLGQAVGAVLHAREDQHLVPVVAADQVRQQLLLALAPTG